MRFASSAMMRSLQVSTPKRSAGASHRTVPLGRLWGLLTAAMGAAVVLGACSADGGEQRTPVPVGAGPTDAANSPSVGGSPDGLPSDSQPSGSEAVPPGAPSADGTAPGPAVAPPSSGGPAAEGLRTVPIRNAPNKVLSRLTGEQFLNAAGALLGEAALVGVAELIPEQVPNGGFSNSGFAQAQPYDVILAYDTAATQLTRNVADWQAIHARFGGCGAYDCINDFIAAFGARAFRRPLSQAEIDGFAAIVAAAQDNALSYDAGVALVVRAMLQAPEFLYLFEDELLTDYQLASRLSFFIANGPPDDELYAAAQGGTLRDVGVLEAQLDRLLEAHGERLGRAFAYDFLGLRRAYQRAFNIEDAVVRELVASAEDTFADMLSRQAPVAELFTTQSFVVNETTAAFMGVAAEGGIATPSASYPLMGLVTHPAVLLAMSNAVEGSTVSRGQFLAHQLLCIPPTPPPDRAFSPEEAGELPPNPTQRDEAEARLQNSSCSPCHLQFEPYAFGLNKWGGNGSFMDDERLNDSGPITTTLGTLSFGGYDQFLPLMGQSEQYERCITDQLIRYGLRHTEYPEELVDGVLTASKAQAQPPTFAGLVRAIVLQQAFTVR